jgi:hypothetical protein
MKDIRNGMKLQPVFMLKSWDWARVKLDRKGLVDSQAINDKGLLQTKTIWCRFGRDSLRRLTQCRDNNCSMTGRMNAGPKEVVTKRDYVIMFSCTVTRKKCHTDTANAYIANKCHIHLRIVTSREVVKLVR